MFAGQRISSQAGVSVFAHCEHGVGRGPLMICAVLVSRGLSAPDALEQVRERRWQSAPNDRQIEGLLAFEAHCRDERWDRRSRRKATVGIAVEPMALCNAAENESESRIKI